MKVDAHFKGIFYMMLASLSFSIMGGAAKMLKDSFDAGQLVFYRNAVGLVAIAIGLTYKPPESKGGKLRRLIFRGIIGTVALYALLFCILHMPLGTAMTYNISSAIWIALFSFLFFGEYNGARVFFAILLGFAGMLLIYKPNMHLQAIYHFAGLISGITSAIAYLTVGRLAAYYDPRIIVLSFLLSGFFFPLLSMLLHHFAGLPADGVFITSWRWPHGIEWIYISMMGLAALFGQYFITRAYGSDRAGIVSAISYSSIVFSIIIGLMLGDAFPDWISITGIICIITSGIIISLYRRHKK